MKLWFLYQNFKMDQMNVRISNGKVFNFLGNGSGQNAARYYAPSPSNYSLAYSAAQKTFIPVSGITRQLYNLRN